MIFQQYKREIIQKVRNDLVMTYNRKVNMLGVI
jgi:hypothetical protein